MSTHSCGAVSHPVFFQTLTNPKLAKEDPSQTFKTPTLKEKLGLLRTLMCFFLYASCTCVFPTLTKALLQRWILSAPVCCVALEIVPDS